MSLGKDISRLVSKGDGEQLEISFLEMLTSNVAVDLNMLGAFVEDIIMSNVDSTTIVTIKRSVKKNLVLYPIQNTQRKQQTWIYFIHD